MSDGRPHIIRIVVEGRVQGVGFRAFVVREALRLDLVGWVRNRRTGGVETVAAGSTGAVSAFAAIVERGPPGARVDDIRLEQVGEDALNISSQPGFFVMPDA